MYRVCSTCPNVVSFHGFAVSADCGLRKTSLIRCPQSTLATGNCQGPWGSSHSIGQWAGALTPCIPISLPQGVRGFRTKRTPFHPLGKPPYPPVSTTLPGRSDTLSGSVLNGQPNSLFETLAHTIALARLPVL